METQKGAIEHLEAFRQVVGAKCVLSDETTESPYLKDWSGDYVSAPMAVVLPSNVEEVSEVMRYCSREKISVIPQGGNTGLVGGCYTEDRENTILLNLGRMSEIRKIDPLNYTMEVEAGCIVQAIQEKADNHDRLFPLSFGAQGSAQIGGALATNAGGLNVLRYGMARDLVLGLEIVLPSGDVINGLSTLIKDNRGLDLKQIFVGSEGTMGIITAATLKLFPKPQCSETAFFALSSMEAVIPFYDLARRECADLLSAFELVPRNCVDLALQYQTSLKDPLDAHYPVYILLDVSSSGHLDLRAMIEALFAEAMEQGLVVDGAVAESLQQSHAMWAIREAMVEAQAANGRHLRTDISVSVFDIPSFIGEATEQVSVAHPDWTALAYGHVGDGNVHFNLLPPQGLCLSDMCAAEKTLAHVAVSIGGKAQGEH